MVLGYFIACNVDMWKASVRSKRLGFRPIIAYSSTTIMVALRVAPFLKGHSYALNVPLRQYNGQCLVFKWPCLLINYKRFDQMSGLTLFLQGPWLLKHFEVEFRCSYRKSNLPSDWLVTQLLTNQKPCYKIQIYYGFYIVTQAPWWLWSNRWVFKRTSWI